MNELKKNNFKPAIKDDPNQRGSAIVITLFVLALIGVFVAIALSRTTSEALAIGNETAEGRTFYAAQASLETMTRNFNKIFEVKLNPIPADITDAQNAPVFGLGQYQFNQQILQTSNSTTAVLTKDVYAGLYAIQDNWRLQTTATDQSGVQVQLTRNILNNRIPIFQFGIFYDDDLEFHPGPRFDFGGRVHSNGNIFMMAGTGLYFSSRVSSRRQILTQTGRNGRDASQWGNNVFIRNASDVYVKLDYNMGSALSTPASGANLCFAQAGTFIPADLPLCYDNANWNTLYRPLFDGNLTSGQKSLDLPLNVAGREYREMIRRGRDNNSLCGIHENLTSSPCTGSTLGIDDVVTARERFANKNGIRVSLADSKAKLPGCSSNSGTTPVATQCGIRLDGDGNGLGTTSAANTARGYNPMTYPMSGGYTTTRLNGNRFRGDAGEVWDNETNEVWIKIELVSFDVTTETVTTQDVTGDILALGLTEAPSQLGTNFALQNNYHTNGNDSRSIVQLQRWRMAGEEIRSIKSVAGSTYMSYYDWGTDGRYNLIPLKLPLPLLGCTSGVTTGKFTVPGETQHQYPAKISNLDMCIVPFPIQMFDTREGLYNDDLDTNAVYPNGRVPLNGVMSMVQINVGNLRQFLIGAFDASMPINTPYYAATGHRLRSSDVPQTNGYVFYVSDRRGDADFDGEYDMEDVYGNNNGLLESGEDINFNGTLDKSGTLASWGEAPLYSESDQPDAVAVMEHKYYRRGVRLVNAQTIPGLYDSVTAGNTQGFTVASENGIYVQGNYNAQDVNGVYGTPTQPINYRPQSTSLHIPAAIIGDAVTILSNSWNDTQSFTRPFELGVRDASETTIRFAMMSGDTLSTMEGSPNQGGSDPRLAGGVHNFKRFLEDWGGVYLNYTGSLINLHNSRNNNGAFKCCNKVYSPPKRNWSFDSSFLDPARLPPGTPFIQYVQTTGFSRTNN